VPRVTGGQTAGTVAASPELTWDQLRELSSGDPALETSAEVAEQVALEIKYEGYVNRQAAQIERFRRMESRPIPANFDYDAVAAVARRGARETVAGSPGEPWARPAVSAASARPTGAAARLPGMRSLQRATGGNPWRAETSP